MLSVLLVLKNWFIDSYEDSTTTTSVGVVEFLEVHRTNYNCLQGYEQQCCFDSKVNIATEVCGGKRKIIVILKWFFIFFVWVVYDVEKRYNLMVFFVKYGSAFKPKPARLYEVIVRP